MPIKLFLTVKEAMTLLTTRGFSKRTAQRVIKEWKTFTDQYLGEIGKRLPDSRKYPTQTLVDYLEKEYNITRRELERTFHELQNISVGATRS